MLTITDAELRAASVPEIDIDALDRDVRTQKINADSRNRAAVIEILRKRGIVLDLDKP